MCWRANPYLCMCCIVQGYACASNTDCAADGPSRSLLCRRSMPDVCSGCSGNDPCAGCALAPSMRVAPSGSRAESRLHRQAGRQADCSYSSLQGAGCPDGCVKRAGEAAADATTSEIEPYPMSSHACCRPETRAHLYLYLTPN